MPTLFRAYLRSFALMRLTGSFIWGGFIGILFGMPSSHASQLSSELISVRDMSENDIPLMLNYWFRSPPGFFEAMSVDPAKMPTESAMEKSLREKITENGKLSSSKSNALVIAYEGQSIGMHSINPLVEGDHGIFHAHIWNPKFRRRGLGMHSYPKACRVFLDRFDLKKIAFKTPVGNSGAIRVKEKLGIREVGEEVISFSIVKDGTLARAFELTRAEVERKWA
jgi:RimJ/RimL family protein N-acetyltransferase